MSSSPSENSGALAMTIADRLPAFPGYETLAVLGRGGMGVVYKARDLSTGELVAIKAIRDGAFAGPQEIARFRIEAEAVARMHHPNIAAIQRVGEADGLPYLVMDYVAGGSLEKRLAAGALPPADAARLVRALASAIAHAHAASIVHRDLKPANILLAGPLGESTADEELIPIVVDFGVAKRLDSQSTAWTQAGAVIGTLAYMAPEQAAGSGSPIGPAADLYSLGAILYELLTGRPPFQAGVWQELLELVLHSEPAPPSRLAAGVPRDLETICLKCLEKPPEDRYPSAAELADDLDRFLAGAAVRATPTSGAERLRRLAAHDGYELEKEIGRGPQSVVFLARQRPAGRVVAVKVFAPAGDACELRLSELRRAAEVSSLIAHPQVAAIQRVGLWDDSPFVVVEHVRRGSLADSFGGRPYPIRESLLLVERLADVVIYMHRQGAVHGNLKPSNVLLAAQGLPTLTDPLPLGGLSLGSADLSALDAKAAGYLAPELLASSDAAPSFSTDIYGLGLILYELLAGRAPFPAQSTDATLEQIRQHLPAPPSSSNPRVAPVLDALCLRCLQKNPWKRFDRVYDLSKWLRTLIDDLPTASPRM